MPRIATTPKAIVSAVVARIVDQVGGLSADTCYVAHPRQAFRVSPGDVFATVWLDGATLDAGQLDGGQVTAAGSISVTIHSAVLLDQAGRDGLALSDAGRGVLATIDDVLGALALYDLESAGEKILRRPLRPMEVKAPRGDTSTRDLHAAARTVIVFDALFDWEL
jgi:hypothetical protein